MDRRGLGAQAFQVRFPVGEEDPQQRMIGHLPRQLVEYRGEIGAAERGGGVTLDQSMPGLGAGSSAASAN